MNSNDDMDKKKSHRARQSGVKANKKKLKAQRDNKNGAADSSSNQANPKAFAINSAIRAERRFRRKEDLTTKKQHIPVVDQTQAQPPPILVAIVGPPKVGKTTLINNLVKNFTKTNFKNDLKGPVTIVISKKRRITLLECNNDINSMIDVAKCADLILLLCDASYGFEIEIFEMLNICKVHGMPKIMGVLTHLDMIRNPKQLRKRKKELKHRFWTEVYDGAKLFYLSALVHGEYLRNEIKNLGRFISVMKFRPISWRGTHSYVIVDRVEDITNTDLIRQNSKCDRDIVLYGYVRGVPLKQENMVHIAGFGDVYIRHLSSLPDPCALPGTEKKRSLLEKERLIYAPMSGLRGIIFDKDAVYIELQGSHSHKEKSGLKTEHEELMHKLIEKKQTLDQQLGEQEFRLFSDGQVIKSKDFMDETSNAASDDDISMSEELEDEVSGLDDSDNDKEEDDQPEWNERFTDCEEDKNEPHMNSESSSGDDDYQDLNDLEQFETSTRMFSEQNAAVDSGLKWKENLAEKARDAFLQRHAESKNLMRLVYGCYSQNEALNKEEQFNSEKRSPNLSEEIGGLFKITGKQQNQINKHQDTLDNQENCFFYQHFESMRNWLDEEYKQLIIDCFVTGKWKAADDAETLLCLDAMSDAESEVYGDFEDLETGVKHSGKVNPMETTTTCKTYTEEEKIAEGDKHNLTADERIAKKMKLKAQFDADYDNKNKKEDNGRISGDHDYFESLKAEAIKQSEMNRNEFENLDDNLRLEVEGYRPGLYVRMVFKLIPPEFIDNFDPSYPILVGALNMSEESIGYVNCKVKKHRWYSAILKSGDPIVISMGWRRFQTVAIYAKVEDNLRYRYLKYTPEHVTCGMTFWGPITPTNTGFLALQTVRHDREELKRIGFRIAATGCVKELDKSCKIMKKLKLLGYPFKIFDKSAFIKGMFNSSLEVAKFEGAKIKTVSGIRGQIKKANHSPEGSFRATFEDRILISDIVICRTWYSVDIFRFYTPVPTLLLPPPQKLHWQGLKTLGQLKRERQIKNEVNTDHLYTEIVRPPVIKKQFTVPKALQKALPYKYKPKHGSLHNNEKVKRVVHSSPHEQKVAKLMSMIEANYKAKRVRESNEAKLRMREFHAKKRAEELSKLKRQKELRKKISRAISKMQRKQQQ